MSLSVLGDLAVVGAGFAAGTINAIVGSGSLITFPTLLALGFPSVVANVSNTVGLAAGSASGAVGYRRELADQWPAIRVLAPFGLAGGIVGAVLLLQLPSSVFSKVVPLLVLLAVGLMAVQPRLAARMSARGSAPVEPGWWLKVGVFLTGIYGGYFGAAQGVILIGLIGVLLPISLQQANGIKNVLAALVNGVAAITFLFVAHVAWLPAILIGISSVIGGQVGARYGRRLAPKVLRWVVVVGGTIIGVVLLVQHHG